MSPAASNTGTWNIGDVYLTTYGYFNVSNVSLPQNCWQLGNWTLQIGPWAVQSAPAYKVTGCATLSNLSVQFSPPYQGSAGGSAVISFDVTKYPLPPELDGNPGEAGVWRICTLYGWRFFPRPIFFRWSILLWSASNLYSRMSCCWNTLQICIFNK